MPIILLKKMYLPKVGRSCRELELNGAVDIISMSFCRKMKKLMHLPEKLYIYIYHCQRFGFLTVMDGTGMWILQREFL